MTAARRAVSGCARRAFCPGRRSRGRDSGAATSSPKWTERHPRKAPTPRSSQACSPRRTGAEVELTRNEADARPVRVAAERLDPTPIIRAEVLDGTQVGYIVYEELRRGPYDDDLLDAVKRLREEGSPTSYSTCATTAADM